MPRLRGPATGILIAVTFVAGVGVGRLEPFAASSGAPAASPDAAAGPTDDGVDDFGLVREAWDLLHEKYVGRDTLDDRELAYGAIDGLAGAVGDTGHTDFMTPEERTSRNDALSGSYVGIGVQLDNTDSDEPRVVTVFHDSPADKAGLRTGDVILEVDGVPAAGSSLDDVVERIRGESGTAVELTVRAGEDGTPRTLKITRGEVEIDAVSWTMVPGTTTGLLRIEQFSHRVAEDVQKALRELRKEGADRLVLDLRGNPGGYVGEAVGTASQFLSSGTVYVERNAAGRGEGHAGLPGRRVDRPAADRAGRRGQRVLVRDRGGRPPGQRPRARSSARSRSAPARSSASTRSRTVRRCASGPSSG